jgi:hypothetical protein
LTKLSARLRARVPCAPDPSSGNLKSRSAAT